MLKGIPASPGTVVGKVFLLDPCMDKCPVKPETPQENLKVFREVLKIVVMELKELYNKVLKQTGPQEADIFQTHLLFMEDPLLIGRAEQLILKENLSPGEALDKALKALEAKFSSLEKEIFKTKMADVRDVVDRLKRALVKEEIEELPPGERIIIAAREMRPSIVASLDKNRILGICAEKGGVNSHAAILARALGIPAVVGVKDMLSVLTPGDEVILDGTSGKLFLKPKKEFKELYMKPLNPVKTEIPAEKMQSFVTSKDGKKIELLANVSSLEDLNQAKKGGITAIGLLRSEFLFMQNKDLPDFEEQAAKYAEFLKLTQPNPVKLRLFDLSEDKTLPGITFPAAKNPALSLRGIRYLLKNKNLLVSQLKALLKASEYGNLQVMLPMVTDLEEIIQFKEIFEEVMSEAAKEQELKPVPVGIMLETPAACLMAHELAKEVAFFSLGSNDLTQYVTAADREDEEVAYLYNHFHPALLNLIKDAVEAAKAAQIEIEICGEMAHDLLSIPLLLGMGLEHLSINPAVNSPIRQIISLIDIHQAYALTFEALRKKSFKEVEMLVQSFISHGYQF